MILVQLILAGLVAGQARDDLRVYRWKHNNPKEDPLQRKSFQALVPGTCDEEISIQVKGFRKVQIRHHMTFKENFCSLIYVDPEC